MLQGIERKRRVSRRLVVSTGVLAAIVAVALALVPAAFNSSTRNGLSAYITVSNRGPLGSCPEQGCLNATTNLLVHVINSNDLNNWTQYTSRTTVPNAFVVNSVDFTTFVNGTQLGDMATITPPTNAVFRSWSGHWPATVVCTGTPGAFTDPCNVVENPAVLPGENTAVVYTSWWHSYPAEPNGRYVFKYTVHGTLNGNPVDLTATSLPVTMTG